MPNIVSITVKLDDAAALAQLAALKKAAEGIAAGGVDSPNLASQLIGLKQKMQAAGLADLLDFNLTGGQINSQILLLKRKIQQAGLSDILDVNLNSAQIVEQISKLQADKILIPVGFDVSKLPTVGATSNINDKVNIQGVAQAEAQLTALNAALADTKTRTDAALVPLNTLSYGWGRATGSVLLFGGALNGLPLVATVGAVHLLIDAIVEAAAVVGPAIVAVGAWGAAAVPTIQAIVAQMKTLYTVSQAYNVMMPGMTNGFSKMVAAVQPSVYSIFGDALTILNQKSGIFTQLVSGTSVVLDNLASRFTLAVTNGNGFGQFLSKANQDVAQFGDIIGNLGGVVGNFFKVMPGYANVLLSVADGFTKVAESVTASGVGQGILQFGLAAHGALLYTGLLTTGLTWLVTRGLTGVANIAGSAAVKLEGMGKAGGIAATAMDALAGGAGVAAALPWGWILTAAVGLGVLAYKLSQVKDANQVLLSGIYDTIASQTTWAGVTSSDAAGFSKINATLATFQNLTNGSGKAVSSLVVGPLGAQIGAVNQINQDTSGLIATQRTQIQRMGELTIAFGSQGAAVSAVTALHMKLGSVLIETNAQFQRDLQSLLGYNTALTEMAGYTGGRALAAQNALNMAQDSQLQAINSITQAQDAYITRLTSSETAFTTYEQAITAIGTASKAAGASIGGLNTQSITLAGDFYGQVVPAAQKWIDAAQQQLASVPQLTKGTADLAKQMVTYAGSNTAARQTIVALINDALGPGTVSLQTLSSWIDKNAGGEGQLRRITDQLTGSMSGLASQVSNLANQAFSAAIFKSSGLSGTLRTLASDLTSNRTSVASLQPVYNALVSEFEKSGLSAQAAESKASSLIAEYGKVPKSVLTTLQANDSQALATIGHVVSVLESINGKTATMYVQTVTLPGGPTGTVGAPHKAMGGVIGAASGGARGNLTLVGEQGPEFVSLPVGSTVHSNADTQAMWSGGYGSAGAGTVQLEVDAAGNSAFEQFMVTAIKYWVRVKGGGNVQAAFGRT